jgi:hypothetical protein
MGNPTRAPSYLMRVFATTVLPGRSTIAPSDRASWRQFSSCPRSTYLDQSREDCPPAQWRSCDESVTAACGAIEVGIFLGYVGANGR